MSEDRPEVLYVCVHNAGRSQMAALFTEHLGGDRVVVRSAGSEPADRVNPMVVTVMAELGLDMSQRFPAPLTDDAVRASDVVVTMGCGDACPFFPGTRYEDWELADPAEAGTARAFEAAFAAIQERVSTLAPLVETANRGERRRRAR